MMCVSKLFVHLCAVYRYDDLFSLDITPSLRDFHNDCFSIFSIYENTNMCLERKKKSKILEI